MVSDLQRFSINTATLGHQASIREIIEAVAAKGFGGIAPWRREIEGEDVPAVARHLRDAGLQVSGYCRSTYIPGASKEAWHANVEDNKRALQDAAELNAQCFVLVVGGIPSGGKDLLDARRQVEEGIAALLLEAKALGVPLAIEPLHPMYAADRACVNTIEQALDICARLDAEATGFLGLAIDVYHTWWDPKLSEMITKTAADGRLLAFHLNDWLVPTTDFLMDRGMIGEGVIDLEEVTGQVVDATFKGLLEVEVFSERLWRLPMAQILDVTSRACCRLHSAIVQKALP